MVDGTARRLYHGSMSHSRKDKNQGRSTLLSSSTLNRMPIPTAACKYTTSLMARTNLRGRGKPAPKPAAKRAKPPAKTTTPGRVGAQKVAPLVAGKSSGPQPGRASRSGDPGPKTSIEKSKEKSASNEKLPPCPGPKLHIFRHHDEPIEWLERLDQYRDEEQHMQGYVFRVRIKSKEYALKVFKDFDPETLRYYWEACFDDEVDPEIITHYLDPFYCECRAYGRIQEALDDGTIKANPAVPCYGYMYLGSRDERILEDSGVALRYEDSDSESQESTGEQAPIRAIVKKLARPISGVTVRRQGKILVDIGTLNMLKIYNRDVRAENFRDGLLVDFGFSFTEPNIFLEDYDEESLRGLHLEDRRMFKDMLNEEKIDIKVDIFGERRQYSTRGTDRELTAK
ncbi:hypothetical protein S40293_05243 [Stachybotrys chartarum IBT 40293]|nr:hypothetical protein S40293_05243 [Stachybotrys chartarum IBT 40293]